MCQALARYWKYSGSYCYVHRLSIPYPKCLESKVFQILDFQIRDSQSVCAYRPIDYLVYTFNLYSCLIIVTKCHSAFDGNVLPNTDDSKLN